MSTSVLLIGDTHIPAEADEIPDKFIEEARKSDLILCTGDVLDGDVLDRLREASGKLRAVRGEEDYLELPEQDLVKVENLKLGLLHGHQLEGRENEEGEEEEDLLDRYVKLAEQMQVDVLVTGHLHKPFRTKVEGVVLMNPGSATGVPPDDGKSQSTCIRIEVEEKDIVDSKICKA